MKTRALWVLESASVAVALAWLMLWAVGAVRPAQASHPDLLSAACTAGPHFGDITTDQTWCLSDSPHVLTDTVTVVAGAVLTIEAGAEVQIADYAAISILGRLEALGTDVSPIIFTAAVQQWKGLAFQGPSASGLLQHVTVRRGGLYNTSVTSFAEVAVHNVAPGQVLLEDSLVTEASGWSSGHTFGITVVDSNFVMSGTTVSGIGCCGDAAMSVSGAGAAVTLTGNTFAGNPVALSISGVGSAMIDHNDFHGNSLAMSAYGDNITVEHNQIHDNGFNVDPRGGIQIGGGSPTINGNIIRNNTSNDQGAIAIGGAARFW